MARFHPCEQLKQPWTLKPLIAEVRDRGPNSKRTLLQQPLLEGWWGIRVTKKEGRARISSFKPHPPATGLFVSISWVAATKRGFFPSLSPLPSWFIYSISRHAGQNGPFLASKTTSYPFAARQILTESHERALWKGRGVFLAGHSQEAWASDSVRFAFAHVVGTSSGCKDSPHLHWRKRTNVWFGEPQGLFCDPLLFIEC